LSKQFPSAFHDVANGTNSVPCAFSATVADDSLNCIAATNPITITVTDSSGNSESILEGQIGAGTTADYNAVAGYDEASGLGTIDANVLVTNWGSVTFASTTTTLTPSETSFTHGTAITISGTVKPASGTATGDVALMTSSTEESQQGQGFYSLSGGAFSGSTDTLPGGTYNIWGQYSGDTSNAESSSTPISITVTPENSEINFALRGASGGTYTATAPPTNVAYGTQLNVSAKVEPAADFTALQNCAGSTTVTCPTFTMPTGTVAFSDNSTALNTAMINAEGDAEYNAPFSVGPHSVTASYAGDNSYNSSTASAIAFTVVKDTPNVYGGASNQTSSGAYVAGQATVFNVLIENGSQSSASSAFSVPVAAPTGTVTVTGFPSGVPTSATLSAGVDPSTLAVAGIATITVPATSSSETYTVSISYPGDSNYNSASGSGTIQIQSFGGTATTTTATSAGSVSPTSSILVTGTVTGTGTTAPTGGVLVYSSGNYLTQIGFSSTSGDVANFSVALNSQLLSQGANFVTLQYTGDSTYAPSAYTLNTGNSISNPLADFTLIPETTIVPIDVSSGASSGTDVINLGAINGFSGAVNLSCTASPGVNCSITPNAPSLSGGSSTATLTVSATPGSPSLTYDVLVTGADAATGNYVHTLGISAAVTGSTVTTSFGLTPSPSNLSLAAGATSGDTSTITVTPIGAYSSTVDLACSVSGPSGATSPATCSLAASSVASASGTDVVTVATTDTTSAGMYTVTVTGTSGTIAQTTSLNVTVSAPAPGTYNVTATLPASISAGGTANSTITVASTSNYDGTITVTCALTASPTGATDVPTCSAGAGTITLSSSTTTGTTTVTVTTTAATSSELVYPKLGGKGWVGAGGGAVLALLVLLWIPARRRNLLSMLGLVILFAALGSMAACGGGGGSSGGGGGGGSPGTTAGSYTFTVTATGSPAQTSGNTTTFTVSVN
jgi:trimeric autotransporter adhesin